MTDRMSSFKSYYIHESLYPQKTHEQLNWYKQKKCKPDPYVMKKLKMEFTIINSLSTNETFLHIKRHGQSMMRLKKTLYTPPTNYWSYSTQTFATVMS